MRKRRGEATASGGWWVRMRVRLLFRARGFYSHPAGRRRQTLDEGIKMRSQPGSNQGTGALIRKRVLYLGCGCSIPGMGGLFRGRVVYSGWRTRQGAVVQEAVDARSGE